MTDPDNPTNDERVLGVSFINTTVQDAVDELQQRGGYLVAPASPALSKLRYDERYRNALKQADVAIADSTLLTLVWRIATGGSLRKISGMSYLACLLQRRKIISEGNVLWVVSSEGAKAQALQWLNRKGINVSPSDFYVLTGLASSGEDHQLLLEIEQRQPRDVIIAISSGFQEQLGLYLRDYLLYRPRIHCVGAALSLMSGEESPIPGWAEQWRIGWLLRLVAQPRMIFPRIGIALMLVMMVFRYRSEMPPLRRRWADV